MNVRAAAGFVLVVLALAFAFSLARAGETAVAAWGAEQARADTAVDMVMRSRQTAAVDSYRRGAAWVGAGLLALALVTIGAILFMLRGGGEFLKQWRLATRKRKRPHVPATRPYAPYVPHSEQLPPVQQARPAARVPELPGYDHEEYEQWNR